MVHTLASTRPIPASIRSCGPHHHHTTRSSPAVSRPGHRASQAHRRRTGAHVQMCAADDALDLSLAAIAQTPQHHHPNHVAAQCCTVWDLQPDSTGRNRAAAQATTSLETLLPTRCNRQLAPTYICREPQTHIFFRERERHTTQQRNVMSTVHRPSSCTHQLQPHHHD